MDTKVQEADQIRPETHQTPPKPGEVESPLNLAGSESFFVLELGDDEVGGFFRG